MMRKMNIIHMVSNLKRPIAPVRSLSRVLSLSFSSTAIVPSIPPNLKLADTSILQPVTEMTVKRQQLQSILFPRIMTEKSHPITRLRVGNGLSTQTGVFEVDKAYSVQIIILLDCLIKYDTWKSLASSLIQTLGLRVVKQSRLIAGRWRTLLVVFKPPHALVCIEYIYIRCIVA